MSQPHAAPVADGESVRPVPPGATSLRPDSYRRLADVFHALLEEQSLDALLDRIADTLGELVPYDTLIVFEADEVLRQLRPVLARDEWADAVMRTSARFGEGITGWVAEHREPVLIADSANDPRVKQVAGTPHEHEALIIVPLVARDTVKGVLNIYRIGEGRAFDESDLELATRFGDAAALALDNAQVRARLEHQANTDALTGLYNHRFFHERLRQELQKSSRTHAPVAVLMLDVDDFKHVNDVHGHGVGDELLRGIADALRLNVRGYDVACRVGGEEFGVILPSCRQEHAAALAARLAVAIGGLSLGAVAGVTVSVGIAEGPEHAMNPRELVACADAAMMAAKARGKSQIVLFDEQACGEHPVASDARDIRSIRHLKLLQSVSGRLNGLNDTRAIGNAIVDELRALIDYHNCRVFVVDGPALLPVAFRGEFASNVPTTMEALTCRVGEGITGRVAQTGESLLLGDAARCEFALQIDGTDPIEESLLAVPLRYAGRVVGVIVVSALGLEQFDEDDVRLLEVLGGHAAVALENAGLLEAQRREAEAANGLLAFSRRLATASGIDEVLEQTTAATAATLGAPQTSVWLDDGRGILRVAATRGYSSAEQGRLRAVQLRSRLFGRAAAEGGTHVLPPAAIRRYLPDYVGGEVVVVPMWCSTSGRRGCLTATVRADRPYTERELRMLRGLADQARLALTNAGNYERLEDTFLTTIEALANALEASDEYTSSHARWITDMALRVGETMRLDSATLERLELGALFHDIGKIGIPTGILNKPGPLDEEERRVMQQHTVLGERILAPIARLKEVTPIVRACHEHYDGGGYPDGRRGNDIPLEARIILVVDAYHAMTSDRPYRRRLPEAEARRRLRESAGTQFDPDVVEAWLRVLAAEERRAA